jgi:proteasome accessory factor C
MAEPWRAQDRLAFLLALVPFLIDRERTTVAEAATHFGVPEQLVRDAVSLLTVSGVPGETRSYQPEDLFDIAWDAFEEDDEIVLTNLVAIDDTPRFSAREAAALIAGLQYLSSLPEHADRAALTTLTAKLSVSASGAPARVAVDRDETDETLAVIRAALDAGTQLELDYVTARGDRDVRRVDPLRVESVDADWYLRAWDHSREAVRTFRIDRVDGVRTTDTPMAHRPGEVALPDTLFTGSDDDLTAEVVLAPGGLTLIADFLAPDAQATTADDGRSTVTLRFSHAPAATRLAAAHAGTVEVTGPPSARAAVRAWAQAALDRYAD